MGDIKTGNQSQGPQWVPGKIKKAGNKETPESKEAKTGSTGGHDYKVENDSLPKATGTLKEGGSPTGEQASVRGRANSDSPTPKTDAKASNVGGQLKGQEAQGAAATAGTAARTDLERYSDAFLRQAGELGKLKPEKNKFENELLQLRSETEKKISDGKKAQSRLNDSIHECNNKIEKETTKGEKEKLEETLSSLHEQHQDIYYDTAEIQNASKEKKEEINNKINVLSDEINRITSGFKEFINSQYPDNKVDDLEGLRKFMIGKRDELKQLGMKKNAISGDLQRKSNELELTNSELEKTKNKFKKIKLKNKIKSLKKEKVDLETKLDAIANDPNIERTQNIGGWNTLLSTLQGSYPEGTKFHNFYTK